MRILTGALFVLGIGWALVAWIVVILPFGALNPRRHYETEETIFAIILSLLSILGYHIWIGWGIRCLTGFYLFGGSRRFWLVSLMGHLLWAIVIPPAISSIWSVEETLQSFWSKPDEIWSTGEGLPYRTWIVLNVIVAIFCLIRGDNVPRKIGQQKPFATTGDNAAS